MPVKSNSHIYKEYLILKNDIAYYIDAFLKKETKHSIYNIMQENL